MSRMSPKYSQNQTCQTPENMTLESRVRSKDSCPVWGGWSSNGLSLPDSCTGELTEQNDLFRPTYALETAKGMHWYYRLLSNRERSGRNTMAISAGVNGIYLSRANLYVAFDDSGRQINPLTACLTGNAAEVIKLFNRCGWQAESDACPAPPVFADGQTGSVRKGGLVVKLCQTFLCETGCFQHGLMSYPHFQQAAGNFELTFLLAFIATFFNTALFT